MPLSSSCVGTSDPSPLIKPSVSPSNECIPLDLATSSPVTPTISLLSRHLPSPFATLLITAHTNAKAFAYSGLSLLLVFIVLSNTLSHIFKTIWSDVGNNWEVIWSYALSFHYSPFTLYVGGTSILHMITYWTYCLILLYFDLQVKPHSISKYKIQPAKNTPVDLSRLDLCLKVVLKNQVLVSLPFLIATYPIAVWRGVGIYASLPSFEQFVAEIVVYLAVEELFFYYSHRLLHTSTFYGLIHKQHHEWTSPIAVATLYCHPVEQLLSNLIPIFIGPLLCGSHLAVIWVWLTVAILAGVNTHSGYHLPFLPSSEAHDFHHLRFNVNFGVIGLLDWFHGTDEVFRSSEQWNSHKTFFSLDEYKPVVRRRNSQTNEHENNENLADKETVQPEVLSACEESILNNKNNNNNNSIEKESDDIGYGLGFDNDLIVSSNNVTSRRT